MAKRKVKKRVEFKLPVHKGSPAWAAPDEVVVVPVPMETVQPEPLAEVVGPTRCVLTLKETFWQGTPYIVLTAAEGHTLPESLKTGQEVEVQFSPVIPAQGVQDKSGLHHGKDPSGIALPSYEQGGQGPG